MNVLLVHAFPFDRRLWSAVTADPPEDVRFHVVDLPGFGASAAPLPSSMNDFGEAIQKASGKFPTFVLCGLSLGGYASLAWWRRHAHDARLAGVVLADTRSDADTAEGRAARDATIKVVEEEGLARLADRLLPRFLSPQASDEMRAQVRGIIESQRPEGVIAATRAMRDRPDSTELLATLDVPVLGIVGELDVISPPDVVERMVGAVPDGRLEVIPAAGHLSNIEQPGKFREALIRFAREIESRS